MSLFLDARPAATAVCLAARLRMRLQVGRGRRKENCPEMEREPQDPSASKPQVYLDLGFVGCTASYFASQFEFSVACK